MDHSIYYRKVPITRHRRPKTPEAEPEAKISSEFDLLMDGGKPNDVYDAVIIHQSPEDEKESVRADRQDTQTRQAMVGKWSEIHGDIQSNIFERYLYHSGKISGVPPLNVRSIGGGIFPMAQVDVTKETLSYLAEIPDVVAVMPNHEVELIEPVGVKYSSPSASEIKAGMTWGLEMLEIPKLWEITKGRGVNVGVLDTGVDGGHPALKDRIKDFLFVDPNGKIIKRNAVDYENHGTHVCGTVAGSRAPNGVSIGVAPEADLNVAALPIGKAKRSYLFGSIAWAIHKKSDIINMSFGTSYNEFYDLLSKDFNERILQYGIIAIAAIGNEGHGTSIFPGNSFNAFAIGAANKNINVANFSSGACLMFPNHPSHKVIIKPDIVAPGVDVYSCMPSTKKIWKTYPYAYKGGTSMAAPHVAGVAALLMSAHPSASAKDIMDALKQTADYPYDDEKRPDTRWGYGFIRPYEAHKALG